MFSCLRAEDVNVLNGAGVDSTEGGSGGSVANTPKVNVWADVLQDINKLYVPQGLRIDVESKSKLPNKKLKTYDDYDEGTTIYALNDTSNEVDQYTNFSCGFGSTYPIDSKKEAKAKASGVEFNGEHLGDPICDCYGINFHEDHVVFCIADGCNWGVKPRDAARTGCKAFIDYMIDDDVLPEIKDTRTAVTHMIRAFSVCQKSILRATTGTSTLLGAVILRSADDAEQSISASSLDPRTSPQETRGRYNFMCLSLGDCKVFRYNKRLSNVQEITERSRPNESDMSDPGGRLGYATKAGDADIRNLAVFTQGLDEGDLVIALTDGVYDNFDPEFLGMNPSDFGQAENSTWKELDRQQRHEIKLEFRNKLILETIGEKITTSKVTEKLMEYCRNTTQASRDWVRDHPDARMPSDRNMFKGKMDHCTVLCFVVGERLEEKEEGKRKGKKKKKKGTRQHKEEGEEKEGKDKEKDIDSSEEN
eukprot:TRINITY_DN4955_c0_g1_i1.p1 TRINITY_DN4955_c0_g1~~TRINITY_DN4955_c0_g1_i1.p1  ORF type:complete len:477 (+),score=124.25 TRINITY_DN4955_c0_g1_i1:225-1655(+)